MDLSCWSQCVLLLLFELYSLVASQSSVQLTSSSGDGSACPNVSVVFTCNVTGRTSLAWMAVSPDSSILPLQGLIASGSNGIRTLPPDGLEGFMFQRAITAIGSNSLTSTLTTVTEVSLLNGATVSCLGSADGTPNITIIVAEPPSTPLSLSVFSQQDGVSSSVLTLTWSPPSSTGGVSVNYTVTISPPPLSGSPVTMETTSTQITVSYNTPYNVTIRAVNCAGTSDDSTVTIAPIVTCPSSLSPVSGVVNIQTPSVPIVGSTLAFSCSEYQDGRTEQSTCGSDGQWRPDPETFGVCPTPSPTAPPVMCPVPGIPSNGSVSVSGQPHTVGTVVTYQCNEGLFPMGLLISTCTRDGQNGVWKPVDPSTVECRRVPVNCTVPEEPSNGTIVGVVDGVRVNYKMLNETMVETTVLTYQCDSGLSLTGPNTIACTNAGVWNTDPTEVLCMVPTTEAPTQPSGVGSAAVAGGVAGGVVVVILIILGTLILCLVVRTKRKKGSASISKTPAGPYYEEVDLAVPVSQGQNIQMESNEAYGQVKPAHSLQHNIELQSNEAYGQLR